MTSFASVLGAVILAASDPLEEVGDEDGHDDFNPSSLTREDVSDAATGPSSTMTRQGKE